MTCKGVVPQAAKNANDAIKIIRLNRFFLFECASSDGTVNIASIHHIIRPRRSGQQMPDRDLDAFPDDYAVLFISQRGDTRIAMVERPIFAEAVD